MATSEATDIADNPTFYDYFSIPAGDMLMVIDLKANDTLYYKVLSGIASGNLIVKRLSFIDTKIVT